MTTFPGRTLSSRTLRTSPVVMLAAAALAVAALAGRANADELEDKFGGVLPRWSPPWASKALSCAIRVAGYGV